MKKKKMKRKFLDFFLKAKKDGQIKNSQKAVLKAGSVVKKCTSCFYFTKFHKIISGKDKKDRTLKAKRQKETKLKTVFKKSRDRTIIL